MPNPSTPGPATVTLIVAHGSRNPRAAEEHERFCQLVAQALVSEAIRAGTRERTATTVRPAYLEMTEPSVPKAIDDAAREGATIIGVLPHFLNSGNHVLVDLPAIVDEAQTRHPGVEIRLESHLGADPGLVNLTASRITDTDQVH